MEAYELFEGLIHSINEQVTAYLAKGTVVFSDGKTLEEARQQRTDMSKVRTNQRARSDSENRAQAAAAAAGRQRPVVENGKKESSQK